MSIVAKGPTGDIVQIPTSYFKLTVQLIQKAILSVRVHFIHKQYGFVTQLIPQLYQVSNRTEQES